MKLSGAFGIGRKVGDGRWIHIDPEYFYNSLYIGNQEVDWGLTASYNPLIKAEANSTTLGRERTKTLFPSG